MPHFFGLTMTAAAEISLKGLAVLAAAFLLNRIIPSTSASFRHTVLLLALITLVIIPFTTMILPKVQLPATDLFPWNQTGPVPGEINLGYDSESDALSRANSTGSALSSAEYFYLAGTLVMLIWLAAGWISAFRLRRQAFPLHDKEIDILFRDLKDRLHIRRKISLKSIRSPGMPAALGIFKPMVCLPVQALKWPSDRLKLVMLHELAHIKRQDTVSRIIGTAACIFYWYNPLVWLALRSMLREQEFACDGLAVRNGIKRSQFAAGLMSLAGKSMPGFAGHVPMLVRRDDLKRRLFELLNPSRKNAPLKKTHMMIAGFLCTLLVLMLSSVSLFTTTVKASEAGFMAEAGMFFYGPVRKNHQDVLNDPDTGGYLQNIHELLISGERFTKNEIESHLARLRTYIDWESPEGGNDLHVSARSKMSRLMEKTQQWYGRYFPYKQRIDSRHVKVMPETKQETKPDVFRK